MSRWISLFSLRKRQFKHSILPKTSYSILSLAFYILLHVVTKLSPFDNKEISASLRSRLDKLITLLLTNLLYNLFSQSTAWLPFAFLSPSKLSEFLTFEVSFSICMLAFLHEFMNNLALTTFFQNHFHYYCHCCLNARGNASFRNQGQFSFLQRDAPTKLLFYLFYYIFVILFLVLCLWYLH